jgi:hypothetical protein
MHYRIEISFVLLNNLSSLINGLNTIYADLDWSFVLFSPFKPVQEAACHK